jgi:hypothetical protein
VTDTQRIYLDWLIYKQCAVAHYQDDLYKFPDGTMYQSHDVQTWYVSDLFYERLYGITTRSFVGQEEVSFYFSIDYDGCLLYNYQVSELKNFDG